MRILVEDCELDPAEEIRIRTTALGSCDKNVPLIIALGRSLEAIYWICAAWQVGQLFIPASDTLSQHEFNLLTNLLGSYQNLPPLSASGVHGKPSDVAALVQSSGTTGQPKLIAFSRQNFIDSANGHLVHHQLLQSDVWLASLPFTGIGGLSVIIRALVLGQNIGFSSDIKTDTLKFWLESGKVEGISLVPTQLVRLQEKFFMPKVKVILVGGDAMPAQCLQSDWPVVASYGLSETCAQLWSRKSAMPGMEINIDDSGEILVKGPSLALGYWKGGTVHDLPKNKNGFFATGDLGVWEGSDLKVVGRKSDVIISGGVKISPQEIETELLAFPGIIESAVAGLSDAEWGQRLVAAIVVNGDFSLPQLDVHLSKILASHKRPKEIKIVKQLPRTNGGKIIRQQVVGLFD
jgi:O-succinylbenzoic acid--CoA ligase